MRRTWWFLQVAARAQRILQPGEPSSVVRLDERRAWKGVEVREPDGKGINVRQGDPGALLDLLEPLAGYLTLVPRFVHDKTEEYQRNVHEVVRVQRDEREGAQRLPQRFEALVEPRRLPGDHERGREPVSVLPVGVHVPTELQTAFIDEALPHPIVSLHPRTLAESSCFALPVSDTDSESCLFSQSYSQRHRAPRGRRDGRRGSPPGGPRLSRRGRERRAP